MIRKFARKVLIFLCCFLMGAVSIVAWSVYNNKKAEQVAKIEASTQTEIAKDSEEQKEDEIKSEESKEEAKDEKKEGAFGNHVESMSPLLDFLENKESEKEVGVVINSDDWMMNVRN